MGVRLGLLCDEGLESFFNDLAGILAIADDREYSRGLNELRKELLVQFVSADRSSCCGRVGFVRGYLDSLKSVLWGSGFGFLVVEASLRYRGLVRGVEGLGPVWFVPLWHPLFDVPWLPGSSIKGVLRSTYELLLTDEPDVDRIDDREVRRCSSIMFGCSGDKCPEGIEEGVGFVKVLDAYPVDCGVNGGLVEADVVTRHYGERTRTELDVRPNPVFGLSIAAGTRFRFTLLLDSRSKEKVDMLREDNCIPQAFNKSQKPSPLELVFKILSHTLENVGVGGKTTRGYGFFDKIEEIEYKSPGRGRRT